MESRKWATDFNASSSPKMNPRVFLDVDPRTEELSGALSGLRALFPDWRLGQLIANLVTAAGGMDAGAIWDMEDEQLLAAARRLIERNRGRRAINAAPNRGST